MDQSRSWQAAIAAAQLERTFVIGERQLRRIPYGSEWTRWKRETCGDCYVRRGQLHVVGCDIEECPACGRQAITCGCRDSEEEGS